MQKLSFKINKLPEKHEYYGFNLSDDNLYLTSDNIVMHNSGKSVLEQAIN